MSSTLKIIIVINLLLCIKPAQGQVNYFSKLYDSVDNNRIEGIWRDGIVNTNEGYLAFSYSLNSSNFNSKLFIIRIDELGDTIKQIVLENAPSVEQQSENVIEINDTLFVGLSTYVNLNLNPSIQGDFCLTQFNLNGDTIWTKILGHDTIREIPQYFIKTSDGGFAIIGQVVLEANVNGDVCLMKCDSAGNFQWEQYYGGSLFESGEALVEIDDSGYLLSGWTRSFGNGQRDFYLIKTDSLGSQEWQKTYGGGGSESGTCIISLNDGNYLLCGGTDTGLGRLIKVNPEGIMIWQKNYTYPGSGAGGNYIFWSIELSDYSLVGVGLTDNTAEGNAGWLIKTDSAGNLLWQRKYNKNSDTDLLYSILLTPDNGFLLGGLAWNETTNNQDAWLIKVDSIGCAYEDCTVGIEEEESKGASVQAYPNPFKNSFTINYTLDQEANDVRIEIYDLTGRSIYTRKAGRSISGNISIDLGECLGIYLLRIIADDKQVHREKLICLQR